MQVECHPVSQFRAVPNNLHLQEILLCRTIQYRAKNSQFSDCTNLHESEFHWINKTLDFNSTRNLRFHFYSRVCFVKHQFPRELVLSTHLHILTGRPPVSFLGFNGREPVEFFRLLFHPFSPVHFFSASVAAPARLNIVRRRVTAAINCSRYKVDPFSSTRSHYACWKKRTRPLLAEQRTVGHHRATTNIKLS